MLFDDDGGGGGGGVVLTVCLPLQCVRRAKGARANKKLLQDRSRTIAANIGFSSCNRELDEAKAGEGGGGERS